MPLVDPVDKNAGILSLTFNQDRTCVAIATLHGVRIFSCDMHKILYTEDIGAVRYCEGSFNIDSWLNFNGPNIEEMIKHSVEKRGKKYCSQCTFKNVNRQ